MAKAARKRAVAYCRVSTAIQADEGISLEAQQGRIVAWCQNEGLNLDVADVFIDAGVSGKRADNRPGLVAALDTACGCGGILVVYSLSRLARSVRDTMTIAERLEGAGADLVSLSEKLDTTSAAGKMIFRLLSVMAEFERDLIVERTQGAVNHKRAKNEAVGHPPYGFRLGDGGKQLVAEPTEAAVVELMRGWQSAGWSFRRITRELNERGITTKRGRAWSHPAVACVLRGVDRRLILQHGKAS